MDRPYKHFNPIYRAMEEWQREFMQQDRDIEALTKGAARQAETIRTLNERNSQLEAEVTNRDYQIELLKAQGRKTRSKVRALKQELASSRNHLGQALTRAEQAETLAEEHLAVAERRRVDNRQLDAMVSNRNGEIVALKDAIERIQYGRDIPLQIKTEREPFRVTRLQTSEGRVIDIEQVRVDMMGVVISVPPEQRRDVNAHAAVATRIAEEFKVKFEQEILNALRGQDTPMPAVRRSFYEQRIERLKAAGPGSIFARDTDF